MAHPAPVPPLLSVPPHPQVPDLTLCPLTSPLSLRPRSASGRGDHTLLHSAPPQHTPPFPGSFLPEVPEASSPRRCPPRPGVLISNGPHPQSPVSTPAARPPLSLQETWAPFLAPPPARLSSLSPNSPPPPPETLQCPSQPTAHTPKCPLPATAYTPAKPALTSAPPLSPARARPWRPLSCAAPGAREGLGVAVTVRAPPAGLCQDLILRQAGSHARSPSFLSKEAATKAPSVPSCRAGRRPPGYGVDAPWKSQLVRALGTPRQCLNGVPKASESHLPGGGGRGQPGDGAQLGEYFIGGSQIQELRAGSQLEGVGSWGE